jgi:hypothetical protein
VWLLKFFSKKVEDLLNLYEVTGDVDHRSEKGMLRELVLRKLFLYVLPPHFGVGTGLVVDAWGRQSRQTDLVVFDKRLLPPFLLEESRGIFPIDSVLCTIEVKSRLCRTDIDQAIESASLLHPRNPRGLRIATKNVPKEELTSNKPEEEKTDLTRYPFCGLFAYDSAWQISNESLPSAYANNTSNLFAICVAKKQFIAFSGRGSLQESRAEAVATFMVNMLNDIEVTAESRKRFGLVEWMFNRDVAPAAEPYDLGAPQ